MGRVALRTTAAQAQGQHYELSEVAHFKDLHVEVREAAEQLRPPAAYPVVAAVAALNSGEAREGLHLVVKASQYGVEVAVVDA